MMGGQNFQMCNESHTELERRAMQTAADLERAECIGFIEYMISDGNSPAEWRQAWRSIAALLKDREKWASIVTARRTSMQRLPWEGA